FTAKNTKVAYHSLSPGCQLCYEGSWSCLFINGRCNCHCFYCPSRQDEDLLPSTNTIPFPDPNDYVEYIRRMGFRGVSFSGGEPLLKLRETLNYIRAVKQAFAGSVHTWLYTNGTLASESALRQLSAAGLDEIRFDIGATGLKLDAAKRAPEFFQTVTVEIPCIPEQAEVLKERIVEMNAAGIKHLNLHQLRLTPHNLPQLIKRDYTYVHGEKVTVLESELTALELIRWTREQEINLAINYCSFVYKNRFQGAAARRKNSGAVCKPHEDVTENGYIRMIEIDGEPDQLKQMVEQLRQQGVDDSRWSMDADTNSLRLPVSLLQIIDCSTGRTSISYAE
ncbi:radical SAM protein, partial [bacterium]|nr:radical SAM protein [bacterium]